MTEKGPRHVSPSNSFGFGGTNSVAILEGVLTPHDRPSSLSLPNIDSPHLFVLSANTQASLAAMIIAYRDWVQQHPFSSLMETRSIAPRLTAIPAIRSPG